MHPVPVLVQSLSTMIFSVLEGPEEEEEEEGFPGSSSQTVVLEQPAAASVITVNSFASKSTALLGFTYSHCWRKDNQRCGLLLIHWVARKRF